MKASVLLFASMVLVLCMPADEVIREQVQVKWFAVPLAATDEQGQCVTDLKPEDIDVYLEGRKIDSFRLVRLGYAVEKGPEGPAPAAPAETMVTFLVFDNILTDSNRLNRAKRMAIGMVKRAEGRQPFVVMSLEYIGGLKYLCGPSRQTGEIVDAIEKQMSASRARFTFYSRDDIGKQTPYAPDDVNYSEVEKDAIKRKKKREQDEYTRTILNYLNSLRTLCLALQTIPHKSVFLFSIGIKKGYYATDKQEHFDTDEPEKDSSDRMPKIRGLQSMVSDLAERINRTGTFMVVLNPEEAGPAAADADAGGLMLHDMARGSGGKYLNATKADMEEKAVELARAFYEVQFADPGSSGKEMLRVDVRGKRPGVSIHSLQRISRGREYGELSDMEKELLAVDAAESSYWSRSILAIRRYRLPQPGLSGKQAAYDLALPAQFLQKEVDIFFVQVDEKRKDAKVSSQSLIAASERHSYAVKPLKGYRPAFFIVCGHLHQAILLK